MRAIRIFQQAFKMLVMSGLNRTPVVLLLVCLLGHSQSPSLTVEIRVRALDYTNGRPLKGHRLAIWFSDSTGEIRYNTSEKLIQNTGEDGSAIFQFKEPFPAKVVVDTDLLADRNCSATGQHTIGDILQRGTLERYASNDPRCKTLSPVLLT
jgi:hypothetical protein